MERLRGFIALVLLPAAIGWGATRIDLPQTLSVEPYEDGRTPVFSDRAYVNAVAQPSLGGFQVVRVPRHLRFDIELAVSDQARIVRLLCDRNDNSAFSTWEPLAGAAVVVTGRSCTLTGGVVKVVQPGEHRLAAGGPICSSPLLVATAGRLEARTISSANKLVFAGDWKETLGANKWKLLTASFAYLAYLGLAGRALARTRKGGAGPRRAPDHSPATGEGV